MMKKTQSAGRGGRSGGRLDMEMQEKEKQDAVEYTPLEVPEVVPGVTAVDYPEISDFLKNMKLKGSLFGFQKEDVYEKMQKLNGMYQARAQQMRDQARGQLKQMKKQNQEEAEELRQRLEKEKLEFQAGLEEEQKQLREALEKERSEAKEQLEKERSEMKAQLEKEREEAARQLEQEWRYAGRWKRSFTRRQRSATGSLQWSAKRWTG